MDSLITAAARALAAGDPLGALNRVALRDDAAALALRGIAMAQLGDFGRAKTLVRRAARAFGSREPLARARCIVAEAEIALASRDLAWPARALDAARTTLEAHGDRVNAAHARYLELRHLLLIGRLDHAERRLEVLDPAEVPSALRSVHELVAAGLSMRRIEARSARAALERAGRAAHHARIPALSAEVESAVEMLNAPAARLITNGDERLIRLDEVESLIASKALVVDACRHLVRNGRTVVPLASRPVVFALVRELAEAWPGDVARDVLLSRAFGARVADESHRARLRVEVGRLRKLLHQIADVRDEARLHLRRAAPSRSSSWRVRLRSRRRTLPSSRCSPMANRGPRPRLRSTRASARSRCPADGLPPGCPGPHGTAGGGAGARRRSRSRRFSMGQREPLKRHVDDAVHRPPSLRSHWTSRR